MDGGIPLRYPKRIITLKKVGNAEEVQNVHEGGIT
jgi:hypothetical protein